MTTADFASAKPALEALPEIFAASKRGRLPEFDSGDLGSSPGAGASSEPAHQQQTPARGPKQREHALAWQKRNRDAVNATRRERAAIVRQFVLDYKLSHPCVDCGETDTTILEFDHRDSSQKAFNIGATQQIALSTVKAEIEKCAVRCANCHRKKTWKENHTPVAQWKEQRTTNPQAGGSIPSGCATSQEMQAEAWRFGGEPPKFDRVAYQRDYMRDLPRAKAEGLTVKQWRTKHGKE